MTTIKNTFFFLFFILLGSFANSQLKVQDVFNPIRTNSRVSDASNILNNDSKITLETLLEDIYVNDSFEVAVVCLQTIGEQVPKDFATELFNYWKIGANNKDNGLLMLLVVDQRNIFFETGYGTETVLTDATSKMIQQEYMLPDFKLGDYGTGLIKGTQAVSRVLLGKVLEVKDVVADNMDYLAKYDKSEKERLEKQKKSILIGVAAWHLVGLLFFLVVFIFTRLEHDPYKKYHKIQLFKFWIWPILFPLTHIFILRLSKNLMSRYRNMIRFSAKNGAVMHKLDQAEEIKYLEKGQLKEEFIKSVDYDVWTTDLDDDLLILKYKKSFSGYHKCPKCGFLTYNKDYDRTITAATYSSSGIGEKKSSCKNCGKTDINRYSIAMLQRSSSSSNGYSGGSGWSSGGSSSGGSWGGGSSGGGGASSSW